MKNISRYIIIDDDPVYNLLSKILIRDFLKGNDIQAFTAAAAGLSYIKSEYSDFKNSPPTFLFLDINMPAMSGWEFLEQYELLSEEIKIQFQIYIVSSSIDSRDKDRAKFNRNVVAYLEKPLTKNKLFAMVAERKYANFHAG
jgi:two-component SAPR family response regulator